ncbi:hypothetical protein C8R44DRAFT_815344, partial [Mycena epipterygia]
MQKGWTSDAGWECMLKTAELAGGASAEGWGPSVGPYNPTIPTADARGPHCARTIAVVVDAPAAP